MITVLSAPRPRRPEVIAVRACTHPRVRLLRTYLHVAFYECCGCRRELRAIGARA